MEQCNFTRQLRSGSLELHQAHQAQAFSPQYVAGTLISELKHMTEARLGREIEYAVLTVPRHVTYAGRQSLRYAGMVLGGFRSVKVVDEQIAAAAAHGRHLQPGDGKVVLVFHVGGRTTHATIFKFINGMPWYINSHDNLFFGGNNLSLSFSCFNCDDFTERLVHHLVELVKQQHGTDIRHDKAALLRLRAECERAKKTLSDQQETIVQVESLVDGSVDLFTAPLTRAKFEELNSDLFERAIHLLDRTVMNAPVVDDHDGAAESSRNKALIDEIVLVGGSSKIPMIRELVKDYFHGRDANPNPNPNGGLELVQPDEAVIHGALLLTRPEAAGYLEECYHPWSWGPPKTATDASL
ncbi:hypothetical protein PR202_ga30239 [Eleusine coracana subsp. coracana]|uniref:Uncharacterized protein n=1 Tax=Eleusine coracana subsp. coracana TaxID=191504 RepID=A0AAV5DLZ2_ELECO|nr:hypothetical protein PR202_ga30239 [Eleusine coracana subsp. coracana]